MRTSEEAVYLNKFSVITNALITNADRLRYYKFCARRDNLQKRHGQKLSRIKTAQNRQNKRKRIYPINHLL